MRKKSASKNNCTIIDFRENEISMPTKALIVTHTNIPFIRAGMANLLLIILAIWIKIGVELIKEFEVPVIGGILLLLTASYFLRQYLSTVSKILFYKDRLSIVGSINTKNIDINKIELIKLSASPSSYNAFISIKVKLKNKLMPLYFNFVVMKSTSFGKFDRTLQGIEEQLGRYGIPFEKS